MSEHQEEKRFYLIRAAKGHHRLKLILEESTKEDALKQVPYVLNSSWQIIEARMMDPRDIHVRLFQLEQKNERLLKFQEDLTSQLEQKNAVILTCSFCLKKYSDAIDLKNHSADCLLHPAVQVKVAALETIKELKAATKKRHFLSSILRNFIK